MLCINNSNITYFTNLLWKKLTPFNFHSCTALLDIIKVFLLTPDAQENCFKKNIKI
jgi:hypothetical protein